ncbi:hypothetical protein CN553_12160 [Bacillus cereus]|uniref:Uncharacterized protein n=1 Tax=Bacillus cereus TaxID=1396 RepID=A0A9X6YM98_BACCE|nr:hypothetical protein [Bacillus cereus]PEN97798.1 hypothetical protein CN553_12160 [Bacillus cereus]
MKKAITWVVNEFGDVEVFLGELDLNETAEASCDYYFHKESNRDKFFEIIGVHEYEIGDWDSAVFDERIPELYTGV